MSTFVELDHCQPRKPVWVTRRRNGQRHAPGLLLLILPANAATRRELAFVEFPDGVEHVAPADISLTADGAWQPKLF